LIRTCIRNAVLGQTIALAFVLPGTEKHASVIIRLGLIF
jgi:hypothetical protein